MNPTPDLLAMQTVLVKGLSHAVTNQCARPYVERLIRSGVQPDFFTGLYQKLWEAELRLYQHNRSFSLPDLMDAAPEIDMPFWLALAELWENPVEVKPEGFIDTLKQSRAVRQSQVIAQQIIGMGKKDPQNVRKWLPGMVSALTQVSHQGQATTWDPDRVYMEGESTSPLFSTGFAEIDALRMGDHHIGGYRIGDLDAYYAVSGGGKSTWAISLAASDIEQGLRVIYLSRETPREVAVTGILRALCGDLVSVEQIEDREFGKEDSDDPAAHAKYEARLRMREQLIIPELATHSLEELEMLLLSVAPHHGIIDPFEGMTLGRSVGQGQTWRESGQATQYLLNLAKICPLSVTQQLSPQQKAEWDKRHTVERIQGFGDNTLYMRARFACVLGKHWNLPRTVHFVCKKVSVGGGDVDLPFDLQYSTKRACIYSAQGYGA